MKQLVSILVLSLLLCAFWLAGCVETKTVAPDGTVTFTEVDYTSIQLMSSATIAAWAASQKNGINKSDAAAVVKLLDLVEEFRADGTVIDVVKWTDEIKAQVPARYQSLAIVMIQVIDLQLKKYGVADKMPVPGDVTSRIMAAIRNGALLSLAPYLDQKA